MLSCETPRQHPRPQDPDTGQATASLTVSNHAFRRETEAKALTGPLTALISPLSYKAWGGAGEPADQGSKSVG